MSDPLDSLITSDNEKPNLELLAKIINKFIRFTPEGEIIEDKPYIKLKDLQKVFLFLLARKVIFIKKLKKEFKEEISPKVISENTCIKYNTVTKVLCSQLKGVTKSINGKHKIPNYNLYKCEELIKK